MTIHGGSEREIPGEWIEAVARMLALQDGCHADKFPKVDNYWRHFIQQAAAIIAILRPLIETETREALAACMIRNGVATGHGDTHADLIMELDGHFERERALASALRAEGK